MKLSKLIKESNIKYQIYQDMDSCLTDFNSYYEHFTGLLPFQMDKLLTEQYGKIKAREIFWSKVDPLGPQFWSQMPWMSDGKELWEFIKQYKPILLSSPSKSKTSEEGKRSWVNEHLTGTQLILRQAKEKVEFASPTSILIDDRLDTCQSWTDAGGIAIYHTSTKNTISELKKLGFQEIKTFPKININWNVPNPKVIYGKIKGTSESNFFYDFGGKYLIFYYPIKLDNTQLQIMIFDRELIKEYDGVEELSQGDMARIKDLKRVYDLGQYKIINNKNNNFRLYDLDEIKVGSANTFNYNNPKVFFAKYKGNAKEHLTDQILKSYGSHPIILIDLGVSFGALIKDFGDSESLIVPKNLLEIIPPQPDKLSDYLKNDKNIAYELKEIKSDVLNKNFRILK